MHTGKIPKCLCGIIEFEFKADHLLQARASWKVCDESVRTKRGQWIKWKIRARPDGFVKRNMHSQEIDHSLRAKYVSLSSKQIMCWKARSENLGRHCIQPCYQTNEQKGFVPKQAGGEDNNNNQQGNHHVFDEEISEAGTLRHLSIKVEAVSLKDVWGLRNRSVVDHANCAAACKNGLDYPSKGRLYPA